MADVFISYKAERRPAVHYLARVLENHGYSVWFDYALLSGTQFAPQIERELRAARAVVVLWCDLSINSEWVLDEARIAKELKTLIPARIEETSLPLGHGVRDTIDLASWDGNPRSGAALDRLLDQIAIKVGHDPLANFRALSEQEAQWRVHCKRLVDFPLDEKAKELELGRGMPTVSLAPETQTMGSENSNDGSVRPTPTEADEPSNSIAHLQVERTAQMSAGGNSFQLIWNNEQLGELRMGNSSAFQLPPGSGNFQVGMHHSLKKTLHLTAPLPLQLAAGEVTQLKIKVGPNLYGFPPLQFWVNDDKQPQTRGWVEPRLSNASLPKGPEKTHSDREAGDKWWAIPVGLVVLVVSGIAIYSRAASTTVDAPNVEEAAVAAANEDPAPKVGFDAEAFAKVGKPSAVCTSTKPCFDRTDLMASEGGRPWGAYEQTYSVNSVNGVRNFKEIYIFKSDHSFTINSFEIHEDGRQIALPHSGGNWNFIPPNTWCLTSKNDNRACSYSTMREFNDGEIWIWKRSWDSVGREVRRIKI